MRGLLLSHPVNPPQKMHRAEEYLNLLRHYYGKPTTVEHIQLQSAGQLPDKFPASANKPIVVLNFNSEAQSRRMPVEKAVKLTKALQAELEAHFVLISGPKEREHCQAIERAVGPVINLAGETGLLDLATVLSNAQLTISTDSGPAHLANAMGCPTLVFFGAGDPNNTAPFNTDLLRVQKGAHACECPLSNKCQYDHPPCMTSLSEKEVMKNAFLLLKNRP